MLWSLFRRLTGNGVPFDKIFGQDFDLKKNYSLKDIRPKNLDLILDIVINFVLRGFI